MIHLMWRLLSNFISELCRAVKIYNFYYIAKNKLQITDSDFFHGLIPLLQVPLDKSYNGLKQNQENIF